MKRLSWIVSLPMLAIFLMPFDAFNRFCSALLVIVSIPFALGAAAGTAAGACGRHPRRRCKRRYGAWLMAVDTGEKPTADFGQT